MARPLPDREESDERLLIEAAQRDVRHFAELYERSFHRVYVYVSTRVHDRAEVEDVVADVFHQALANLPRFEWRGVPFVAWLYRIAANAIADRAARAFRERSGDPPELAVEPETEQIRQRARLFEMVEGLPPEQRKVIEMRFAAEMSIRDAARELGKSEGAVKQLQLRALRNLRDRLRGNDG